MGYVYSVVVRLNRKAPVILQRPDSWDDIPSFALRRSAEARRVMAILPSVLSLYMKCEPSDFRRAGGIVFRRLMVCGASNLFP